MTTGHEANTSSLRRQFFTALVLLLGLLMLVPSSARAAQPNSPPATAQVDTDRWLEIDLYWFRQNDIQGSAREFWDRFQPLFAGVRGDRGVILQYRLDDQRRDGVVRRSASEDLAPHHIRPGSMGG